MLTERLYEQVFYATQRITLRHTIHGVCRGDTWIPRSVWGAYLTRKINVRWSRDPYHD